MYMYLCNTKFLQARNVQGFYMCLLNNAMHILHVQAYIPHYVISRDNMDREKHFSIPYLDQASNLW